MFGNLSGLPLQILACVAVSSGFLAFGYDQGVANVVQSSKDWQTYFPSLQTDTRLLGAVLGMFVIGAFLGCMTNSLVGNRIGRRTFLIIGVVWTLIGTGLQSGSISLGMWIVARLINGWGVGVVTSIAPVYIAELVPARVRGRLLTLELVLGSAGLLTAFCMVYAYRNNTGPSGWREPLAWQAIPILVTLFACLGLPESPRYMAERGQYEKAERVLIRSHGDKEGRREMAEIRAAIALEHTTETAGWFSMFANNDQCFRYRTLLAVGVNCCQQLTGVNMATYYAGNIIGSLGFGPYQGDLTLIGLGLAGHVGCILGCLLFIDRIGRVRFLMIGAFFLSVGQAFLAGGIAHLDTPAGPGVAAFGLYLFIFMFSTVWLPGGWIYGPEITPLAIRSKASSLGNAVQYLLNFAVVEVTPVAIKAITWKFYVIFAILNAALIPILYFFFPEPANLTLEEIDLLFYQGKVTVRRDPRAPVAHPLGQEFGLKTDSVLPEGEKEMHHYN